MTSGVLYIVFGQQYQVEAKRSISSLRLVCPTIPIAVVTDAPWTDGDPVEFVLRPPLYSFECKPRYMYEASPFERTLFLDADTYVARDISDIFELLELYDIGVIFEGPQLNEPQIRLHTQCNSGVVLFRRKPEVSAVFQEWYRLYLSARTSSTTKDIRGVGDQRYLAIAIAKSSARPLPLASYLHFILFNTTVTYSPPYVYAGRLKRMEAIDRFLTRQWDPTIDWHPRLWVPNIKGALPAGVRRSDPLLAAALIFRRIYNEVKLWSNRARSQDRP